MTETIVQIDRLIEIGRYVEARRLLARRFAESPDDPELHVQAARVALLEDDHETAFDHVGRALGLEPSHFTARLVQFVLLEDERRFAEAEQVVLGLLRDFPEVSDLYAHYARLMLFTAHIGKARALVAEAQRLEPDSHEAALTAVLIGVVAGDRGGAGGRLAELLRVDPEGERTVRMLLLVLIESKRHREALALGQQLLRAHPDDERLREALIDLRTTTHWLALPLLPMARWGWAASATIWAVALGAMVVLRRVAPQWLGPFVALYLAWAVYTWVAPGLLRRWIAWRGLR